MKPTAYTKPTPWYMHYGKTTEQKRILRNRRARLFAKEHRINARVSLKDQIV